MYEVEIVVTVEIFISSVFGVGCLYKWIDKKKKNTRTNTSSQYLHYVKPKWKGVSQNEIRNVQHKHKLYWVVCGAPCGAGGGAGPSQGGTFGIQRSLCVILLPTRKVLYSSEYSNLGFKLPNFRGLWFIIIFFYFFFCAQSNMDFIRMSAKPFDNGDIRGLYDLKVGMSDEVVQVNPIIRAIIILSYH